MRPEDLGRLSALLDEAIDLDKAARDAWLAALPEDVAGFGPTLRELLALQAAAETGDILARPPLFTVPAACDAGATAFHPDDTIGPYRLLRELAHGGMGEVWLAERSDGQLKRAVALKLPMLGIRRSVLVQRFARERDILGALAHPHIARLYDAGLADDGQPYLALEYVEGLPITAFCSGRKLDLRARVALLLQVMEAVQYAHGNLVIHRDLKPSNVLVTRPGAAMLLDFGIAKLLQSEEAKAQETELTRLGGRSMTLDYAAPEQIIGAPISIATDVYALGVLLYEMTSGERPFNGDRHAVERAILSQEPSRPKGAPADLATIIMKALKKRPGDRYATVNAFAEDLGRWERGEPVLAQPDSRWYRASKFISRHRTAVTAAAATLAIVIGATAVSVWEAERARQEAARALAVQDFLLDLFRTNTAAQPDPERARKTTARELLDLGATKLGSAMTGQRESRLILAETLGELYGELGLWPEASRLSAMHVALARELRGAGDPRLASALVAHAHALDMRDRDSSTEVIPLLREAEGILDARGDHTSVLRARVHVLAAENLTDHSAADARVAAEHGVAIFRDYHPDDRGYVDALEILARLEFRQGEHATAIATIERALALARTQQSSEFRIAPLLRRAGEMNALAGNIGTATPLLREALATTERLHGEHNAGTVFVRLALARHLSATGRALEARELADRALADAAAPAGSDEPFQLQEARRMAFEVYWNQGDIASCRRLLAATFNDYGANAVDSFEHADQLLNRAIIETEDGDFARARASLNAARAMADRVGFGPQSLLGHFLAVQEIQLLLATGDARGALKSANLLDPPTSEAGLRARVLAAAGRPDEARRTIDAALRRLESAPEREWQIDSEADMQFVSGELYVHGGDCRSALPALERSADLYARAHVPASPRRLQAEAMRDGCRLKIAREGNGRTVRVAASR